MDEQRQRELDAQDHDPNDREVQLRADACALDRLYAKKPELRRQKEALVTAVAARAADALPDDHDEEYTEHVSRVYDLSWREQREKDAEAKQKLDRLRAEGDEVIAELDEQHREAREWGKRHDARAAEARWLSRRRPRKLIIVTVRRPIGHERRPGCNHRQRGSRRGSRASPDDPDGSSSHSRFLALRRRP
jgi:hypothetical protein